MRSANSVGEVTKTLYYAGLACLLAVDASPAWAQDEEDNLVNFAFATWIGTGVYRISGRSVAILRLPFSIQLKDPDPAAWSLERFDPKALGLKLRLPITVGSQKFADLPGKLEAVTFVPGLELQLPIRDNWFIKPFMQLGIGQDFSTGDTAVVYGAGVSSLYRYPVHEYTLSFGSKLLFAGSTTEEGDSSGFSKLDLGLDVSHPLSVGWRDRQLDLSVFYIASLFGDNLNLLREDGSRLRAINHLHQVGLTLGAKPRFSLGKLRFPRVGLSYAYGNNLKAIRISGEFPF